MRKTLIFSLFSIMLSFILPYALPPVQAECPARPRLDVFYCKQNNYFLTSLSEQLHQQADAFAIDLHEHIASGNLDHQFQSISTHINEPSLPLAVNIIDVSFGNALIDLAMANGKPLIFFNCTPDPLVMQKYPKAFYVGSDSAQSGALQAEILLDFMAEHPSIDRDKDKVLGLVLIKGQRQHQSTALRTTAALERLQRAERSALIIYEANGDWTKSSGEYIMREAIAEAELKHHPIEAVLCNNDEMALGALQVLQEKGYNLPHGSIENFIPLLGIDGLPQAQQALQEGTMLGTIRQDISGIAALMLALAHELACGNSAPQQLHSIKNADKYFLLPFSPQDKIITPHFAVNTAAQAAPTIDSP